MTKYKIFIAAASLATLACAANAQTVQVEGAWARASVPGQQATGAFMTLTAPQGAKLVGASSPAAGVTEIHEMVMQNDVMRMRPIQVLELPAGKAIELKPGGLHVMLLDLKAPLVKDSQVPITLLLRDAKGAELRQELQVPVRALAAPAAAPAHGHDHKH